MQKKKFQKKKAREKAKHQELIKTREIATAKQKNEKAEEMAELFKEKETRKFQKEQAAWDDYASDFVDNLEKLPKATQEQIMKNLEMLEEMQKNS